MNMNKLNDLPVYRLDIVSDQDSEVEVDFIALVDKPAIQRQFMTFNADDFVVNPGASESEDEFIQRCMGVLVGDEGKDQDQAYAICQSKWDNRGKFDELKIRQAEKKNFAIQSEEERIVSGPLMLADTPIFRVDSFGEYYVYFTADTIKQIAQKFFKKGYQSNVNLMHDGGQQVDGVTMFESWIVDKKRGILPMAGFEDVPDGSWFGSFKVENDDVWNDIKAGKFKGFSVEGVFNYVRENDEKEAAEKMRKVVDILNQYRQMVN